MANDRWLSVDDVADYLGVKRFTVYRWIDKRGLPAHKSGKLWLLRKDEVDHWVRSGGRVVEDAQSSPPVCQGAADAGDAKLMLAAIPRAPHPLVAIHRELADVQLPEKAESEQRGRFKLAISPATQIAIIPDVARAQVGVVMGLASGVDMPVRIEALPIAGEGKVLPVGSVGRVMPESTAAAVAYVMSHAGDLGIQAATLALTDVAIVAEIGDIPAQSE